MIDMHFFYFFLCCKYGHKKITFDENCFISISVKKKTCEKIQPLLKNVTSKKSVYNVNVTV